MDKIEQLIKEIDDHAFQAFKAGSQLHAVFYATAAVEVFNEVALSLVDVPDFKERETLRNRATQHVARAWHNAAQKVV